jgi:hypothetical protein
MNHVQSNFSAREGLKTRLMLTGSYRLPLKLVRKHRKSSTCRLAPAEGCPLIDCKILS